MSFATVGSFKDPSLLGDMVFVSAPRRENGDVELETTHKHALAGREVVVCSSKQERLGLLGRIWEAVCNFFAAIFGCFGSSDDAIDSAKVVPALEAGRVSPSTSSGSDGSGSIRRESRSEKKARIAQEKADALAAKKAAAAAEHARKRGIVDRQRSPLRRVETARQLGVLQQSDFAAKPVEDVFSVLGHGRRAVGGVDSVDRLHLMLREPNEGLSYDGAIEREAQRELGGIYQSAYKVLVREGVGIKALIDQLPDSTKTEILESFQDGFVQHCADEFKKYLSGPSFKEQHPKDLEQLKRETSDLLLKFQAFEKQFGSAVIQSDKPNVKEQLEHLLIDLNDELKNLLLVVMPFAEQSDENGIFGDMVTEIEAIKGNLIAIADDRGLDVITPKRDLRPEVSRMTRMGNKPERKELESLVLHVEKLKNSVKNCIGSGSFETIMDGALIVRIPVDQLEENFPIEDFGLFTEQYVKSKFAKQVDEGIRRVDDKGAEVSLADQAAKLSSYAKVIFPKRRDLQEAFLKMHFDQRENIRSAVSPGRF